MIDWCDKCEEMMQPFLDGTLSDHEVAEAESHLEKCSWCAKRYHFEEQLRHYVRVAVDRADAARAEGQARGTAHAARRLARLVDVAGRLQV